MKRTIFIWDIHWCYNELELLLAKLEIKEKDEIYFTWDLVNKWPKSFKVLKFLYKNQDKYKSILWNHDLKFFKELKENKFWDNKSFQKLAKKLEKNPEIFDFFKNLPLYIEKENFILIHWWLMPWKKLEEHKKEEITNLRIINSKPWYEYYSWEKKVIYGHWAMQWLKVRQNTIWIDSWCCYWSYLTAYILETWEIIQQSALKQYSKLDYSHINPMFF